MMSEMPEPVSSPPRVLLDTYDDYGRHVWLRISDNFFRVLLQRPEDIFSLLASQRPGSFEPGSGKFICWHMDEMEGYRIAEVLVIS